MRSTDLARRRRRLEVRVDVGAQGFGVGAVRRLPFRLAGVGVEEVGQVFGVGPADLPGGGQAGGLEVVEGVSGGRE